MILFYYNKLYKTLIRPLNNNISYNNNLSNSNNFNLPKLFNIKNLNVF